MLFLVIKMTTQSQLDRDYHDRCDHFFPMCLATDAVSEKNPNPEQFSFDIEYSTIKFDEVQR